MIFQNFQFFNVKLISFQLYHPKIWIMSIDMKDGTLKTSKWYIQSFTLSHSAFVWVAPNESFHKRYSSHFQHVQPCINIVQNMTNCAPLLIGKAAFEHHLFAMRSNHHWRITHAITTQPLIITYWKKKVDNLITSWYFLSTWSSRQTTTLSLL